MAEERPPTSQLAEAPGDRERLQLVLESTARDDCADSDSLQVGVAELLGWQGIGSQAAPRRVEVRVHGSADELIADIRWLTSSGGEAGARRLSVPTRDCERLRDAIVFALAVERGFDPTQPKSAPPPEPVRQKPTAAKPPPLAAHPQTNRQRPQAHGWSAGAGIFARGGSVPELGIAPRLTLSGWTNWYGVEVSGLALLPRSHVVAEGRGFDYWEASAMGLVCAGWQALRLCPAAEVFYARVHGFGAAIVAASDAGLGYRSGALLAIVPRLSSRWAIRLDAGIWVPLPRHDVELGGTRAWSASTGYSLGMELRRDVL